MPPLQRVKIQGSPILGFPFIYAYTLCRRTINFGMVTRGDVLVFWGHQESEFQGSSIFWGSVFPLTHFNAERPNSA